MKKNIIICAVIVITIITAYFILREKGASKASNEIPVIATRAAKQTIYDQFDAVGNTNSLESVNITASITEAVRKLNFDDGQIVKKGDILVELDHDEEDAQLKSASAELKEQEREIARTESLLKNKAATKKEFDERITLLEIAKNKLNEIQAKIDDRVIRAPFDGVLGLRNISIGTLVQPGGLITTIDNISQIKVDFNVPALYLRTLKIGMPVNVNIEALDKAFQGTVANIDSRVSTETRTVAVRAIIPNEDNILKPGLVATVTLLQDKRDAVIIPEESITQKKDEQSVFIVNPQTNEVNKRVVKVGTRTPGNVEITEGIQVGEIVVVRGLMQITEGKKVKADIQDVKQAEATQVDEGEPQPTPAATKTAE